MITTGRPLKIFVSCAGVLLTASRSHTQAPSPEAATRGEMGEEPLPGQVGHRQQRRGLLLEQVGTPAAPPDGGRRRHDRRTASSTFRVFVALVGETAAR
jgi:hypothetical protein